MGSIQPEIDRINGAKTTLSDYLRAKGITVDASARIDVLAGQLADIASLTLTGITITTPPAKTAYNAGETFDPAGMVVTANFSNGASLAVTNYSVPTGALEAGITSITVSLAFGSETKTATQAITVEEKKSMSYSGTHTTKTITSGGVEYTLYTITGSGTLTVEGTFADAAVWVCGGGAGGGSGYGGLSSASGGYGGGGGYCADHTGGIAEGTYTITVGAAGGASAFAAVTTANGGSGRNGGTGGGGSGKGDGIAKYPFGDTTNFKCHCAGGGGGNSRFYDHFNPSPTSEGGGNGGSNGGNGTYSGSGTGGTYGGGNGGRYYGTGNAATFYGSGGGGGGGDGDSNSGGSGYAGGAGYQGVVYIRIPAA